MEQLQSYLNEVEAKLRFKRTRFALMVRELSASGRPRDEARVEIDELAADVGQMETARIKLMLELVLQNAVTMRPRAQGDVSMKERRDSAVFPCGQAHGLEEETGGGW